MKKIVQFIIFSIFLMWAPSIIFAHPPQSIILEWDDVNKTLLVYVTHFVDNPQRHFIKKIRIEVEGKLLEKRTYTDQKEFGGQKDIFKIDSTLTPKKITVIVECNLFGSMRKDLEL